MNPPSAKGYFLKILRHDGHGKLKAALLVFMTKKTPQLKRGLTHKYLGPLSKRRFYWGVNLYEPCALILKVPKKIDHQKWLLKNDNPRRLGPVV